MSETADNKFCNHCKWCSGRGNRMTAADWMQEWIHPNIPGGCMDMQRIRVTPLDLVTGSHARSPYDRRLPPVAYRCDQLRPRALLNIGSQDQ